MTSGSPAHEPPNAQDEGRDPPLQGRLLLLAGVLAGLLLFVVVIWGILSQAEKDIRTQAVASLQGVLQSSHRALRDIWADDLMHDTSALVQTPQFAAQVETLLAARSAGGRQAVLSSPALSEIRQWLHAALHYHRYSGFFVISREGLNLAAADDSEIGSDNPLARHWRSRLDLAFRGQIQIVPPMSAEGAMAGSGKRQDKPVLYVLAPVKDDRGEIIAVLALGQDPLRHFSHLVEAGHPGNAGEIYAFDRQGRLLSKPRFAETWRAAGLLGIDQEVVFNVLIRDPGVDIRTGTRPAGNPADWPLTRMAQRATAGGSGSDAGGYRDFRGVRVLGAWLWDERLGIGFAAEIDEEEALAPFHRLRSVLAAAVGLGSLICLGLIGLTLWVERRSARLARESAAYLRNILDNTVDAVVSLDERGIVEAANPAAERLFGQAEKELIGNCFSRLVPGPEGAPKPLQGDPGCGDASSCIPGGELTALHGDGERPIRFSISESIMGSRRVFVAVIHDLSAEVAAQRESARHAATLGAILEASTEGILAVDADGRVEFANSRFWRMWGMPDEIALTCGVDVLSAQLCDRLADPQAHHGRMRSLLATVEDRMESLDLRDGRIFECVSKARTENGRLAGRVWTYRDVTARERTREELAHRNRELEASRQALEESRERFRTLVESTSDWVWEVDAEGRYTFASKGIRDILGYEPQEVLGCTPFDFMPRAEASRVEAQFRRIAAERGLIRNLENVNLHKDGREVVLETSGMPILGPDGQLLGYRGLDRDITSRRRAEQVLRQARDAAERTHRELTRSEKMLRRTLSAAGAGYWELDVVSGALQWDARALEIYGIGPQVFAGRYADWTARTHPEDRSRTEKAFRQALQDKSVSQFTFDYRIVLPGGEPRSIRITGSVDRDRLGAPTTAYGLFFDDSARRRDGEGKATEAGTASRGTTAVPG